MREVITIQIPRPKFEDMSPKLIRELVKHISSDIATQIVEQERLRQVEKEIKHWQNTFMQWYVEDQTRASNGEKFI